MALFTIRFLISIRMFFFVDREMIVSPHQFTLNDFVYWWHRQLFFWLSTTFRSCVPPLLIVLQFHISHFQSPRCWTVHRWTRNPSLEVAQTALDGKAGKERGGNRKKRKVEGGDEEVERKSREGVYAWVPSPYTPVPRVLRTDCALTAGRSVRLQRGEWI